MVAIIAAESPVPTWSLSIWTSDLADRLRYCRTLLTIDCGRHLHVQSGNGPSRRTTQL